MAKAFEGMLNGKVAVITGAGRGIGRTIALGFSQAGASVMIADINGKSAEEVATEIRSQGGKAESIETDVTSFEQVAQMAQKTLDSFKRIDILVNNAGFMKKAFVSDMTLNEWKSTMDINLGSVFICSKVIGETMAKQKSGSIINLSSFTAYGPFRGGAHYAAAKAGVISFTRTLSAEWGMHNIRVNAIAPGIILTPLLAQVSLEGSQRRREQLASVPLGRLGKPEEVAAVAIFLASDASSFVSGQIIPVTGAQIHSDWSWD